LLKDKSEQTYTSTFNVLNTSCLKIDSNFKPKIIYIDFEKAVHNFTTYYIWPNISMRGCRFHPGQAWWRKIQPLGSASQYSNDGSIREYLACIFGLLVYNLELPGHQRKPVHINIFIYDKDGDNSYIFWKATIMHRYRVL